MSVFTGCGVNPEETAATLGEETVSAGLVNFMAKYQKAAMDDMYVGYFGEGVWDLDMTGSGSTLRDNLVDSVVSTLHEIYTLKAHAADYKIEITDEEAKAIKDAATAFMTSNSEKAIKEFGATQELVEEMLTLYTIQWNVYNAIIEKTDREVSDEDANMRGYSYIQIAIDGKTVDGKFVNFTTDEVKKIEETADKMVEELANSKLEDIAKKYDYKVTEDAYSTKTDDSTMDANLLKALKKLKEGECSTEVVESKDGKSLYILRIDADTDKEATEDNREAIIAERESKLYSDTVKAWQKDDGWTVNESVINKIDFHNIFTQKDPSKESEKESGSQKESGSEKETGSEKGTESEKETTTEK